MSWMDLTYKDKLVTLNFTTSISMKVARCKVNLSIHNRKSSDLYLLDVRIKSRRIVEH